MEPPKPFAFVKSLWMHPEIAKKNKNMIAVPKMKFIVDKGIEGAFNITRDHRPDSMKEPGEDSKRHVSIIFQSTIDEVEQKLDGKGAFDGGKVRSNIILVENPEYKLNIYEFTNRMRDEIVILGNMIEGARFCLQKPREPCNFMNKVLQGSKREMDNGYQGIFASVVGTGESILLDGLYFAKDIEVWKNSNVPHKKSTRRDRKKKSDAIHAFM